MSYLEVLKQHGKVLLQEPLKYHTTYRIGGIADYYILPDSLEDFQAVLSILKTAGIPWLILGKGSNVLISDAPFHGAVISLEGALNQFWVDENHILHAQAGCSLIALSHMAQKMGLSGLEFASGIPGSIGGGLYMNAGAYRSDLSDLLIDVQVLKEDRIVWMAKEELDYSYRHSAFQKHKDWIVLGCRLQLTPGDPDEIRALMDSRKNRRKAAQPLEMPCAGSVFRNPAGMNAWQIVEHLGYRGMCRGGAMVSDKHCNFIVNQTGRASFHDVCALIDEICHEARSKMQITLIPEIERIDWSETGQNL